MNRHRTAVILIVCSLMFAVGAYILFSDTSSEVAELRQEVAPPPDTTAKAPDWVSKGQSSKPDYSPSDTQAHNATPVPEDKTTAIIEVKEDSIVTFTFVESLADFLLLRFHPQDANGKPATLASAKALNMYYGREMDGFSVRGDDIRAARKELLDYAFTPDMIKTLYALYVPVFMEHIVDTATTDEREFKVRGDSEQRALNKIETGVMLKLNALRIEQTASIMRAIANDPEITRIAGRYLQAAKAVERANVQLQNAIADGKSTAKASKRLKQAIMQREQEKKAAVARLKKSCPNCPDSELFYMAQWSYRRVLGEPDKKLESFTAAAEVLDDLAGRFRTAAVKLGQ